MATTTLYGEKIAQWNNDKVMVVTDQNGAVYYMLPADVADAMADRMRTATAEKNGLLPSSFLNSLNGLCLSAVGYEGDLDTLYQKSNAGICCINIVAGTKNKPDSGIGTLLHVQRTISVSTSQLIAQVYFSSTNKIFHRIGNGDGTKINYSSWITL